MERINYSKIDPWIKKNPEAQYEEFKKAYPKFEISSWSFRKHQKIVLGLPLTASMKPGYRPGSGGGKTTSYSTVWSTPVEDVKKKSSIEVMNDIIQKVNSAFNLHLEVVRMTAVGEEAQPMFEVRRYSKG